MKAKRPVVLLILDGWGIGEDDEHNAIHLANTPTIDHLLATYPNGPIGAAGEHIGLTPGHQGSTEIGHLIMSAGRNVQLAQIQMRNAIDHGEILTNSAYVEGVRRAKKRGGRVHIMGLLSDAGVHSYDETCHELLQLCAQEGLQQDQVFVHIFSDGRDTPPEALFQYVGRLQAAIDAHGVGVIASIQGRFWAMDRDHRWERIEAAYNMLVCGKGMRTATTITDAIKQAQAAGETDEFIQPTLIDASGVFQDGDTVINFNYRVDREIEITQALIEPEFEGFAREKTVDIHYVASLPYYEQMAAPSAFERVELSMHNILPEVLSREGYTQYRVTETEKWAYVTKIFNGMREEPFTGEERNLIPTAKVQTFDLAPEMQAVPIANDIAAQLRSGRYDFILSNICNADMLGHTGNTQAAIAGCEAIDQAVRIIYAAVQEVNGILLITADHGDAEKMWDFDNDVPHTQHTDSFVPFILVDDERTGARIRETGTLQDVAPTILKLFGISQPKEMTGGPLLIE